MLHPLQSNQTKSESDRMVKNTLVFTRLFSSIRVMILLKWLTGKRIFLLSMGSNGFENPKTEHHTHCLQSSFMLLEKKNQSFYLNLLSEREIKKLNIFIGVEVADLHHRRSGTFLVQLFCKSSLLRIRCPSCEIQSRSRPRQNRTEAPRYS